MTLISDWLIIIISILSIFQALQRSLVEAHPIKNVQNIGSSNNKHSQPPTPVHFNPCDHYHLSPDLDGCQCFNNTKASIFNNEKRSVLCCCTGQSVSSVPQHLPRNVTKLILSKVSLDTINENDFALYDKLDEVQIIEAHNLKTLNGRAFSNNLLKLFKIVITQCSNLISITDMFFMLNKNILTLIITHTSLKELPKMENTESTTSPYKSLHVDLSHNKFERLKTGSLANLHLESLHLSFNRISTIEDFAFSDSTLSILKLDNNPIVSLAEQAFAKMDMLNRLDLSNTYIDRLPEGGLEKVKILTLKQTPNLKKFPSIYVFRNLKEAYLTYPYHCCYFKHPEKSIENIEQTTFKSYQEKLRKKYCKLGMNDDRYLTITDPNDVVSLQSLYYRPKRSSGLEKTTKIPKFYNGVWGQVLKTSNANSATNEAFKDSNTPTVYDSKRNVGFLNFTVSTNRGNVVFLSCGKSGDLKITPPKRSNFSEIKCYPEPDALNPCEDVIGFPWLRIVIWLVWILAIFGNTTVFLVLCASRQVRQHVNHFLIVNLAFADFWIGVYLAMLAVQDLRTSGIYYNFAVDWQTGNGCKFAGFLSIFASELSIYIMVLISSEVWFNTKYLFYGRRFQLRAAIFAVFFGYCFSALLAILPLTDVTSSYSSTSTCLPLRFQSLADRVYLICVLCINFTAFSYIVFNYLSVYRMVSGSCTPSAHRQDVAIAKTMAMLIVTDFLCWAPTIFFGVTAALDMPLIDITSSKILLVLFFPINSFANPFLYVFLTKMFRKDMSKLSRKYTWLRQLRSAVRFSGQTRHHKELCHSSHDKHTTTSGSNNFGNFLVHSSNSLFNTLSTLTGGGGGKKGSATCSTSCRSSDCSFPHIHRPFKHDGRKSLRHHGRRHSHDDHHMALEKFYLAGPYVTENGKNLVASSSSSLKLQTQRKFSPHMSGIKEYNSLGPQLDTDDNNDKNNDVIDLQRFDKSSGYRSSRFYDFPTAPKKLRTGSVDNGYHDRGGKIIQGKVGDGRRQENNNNSPPRRTSCFADFSRRASDSAAECNGPRLLHRPAWRASSDDRSAGTTESDSRQTLLEHLRLVLHSSFMLVHKNSDGQIRVNNNSNNMNNAIDCTKSRN